MRLAVEELGRPPPPPPASCLKRDEPDSLSNGRQVGVRRTHCSHVIVVVWANPLLFIELMHHQVSKNSLCFAIIALHLALTILITLNCYCSHHLQVYGLYLD